MPDIKTEMLKVANAWDKHEQTIRTEQTALKVATATGNATKDAFRLIKEAPYKYTQVQAADALHAMGYKSSTAQSLITQLKRAELLGTDSQGKLYAKRSEYMPIGSAYKRSLKSKAVAQQQAQAWAGIAALQPDTRAQEAAPAPLTAKTALAQLSVAEAYTLYVELHSMFGGAK